jgi:hypothetical protein
MARFMDFREHLKLSAAAIAQLAEDARKATWPGLTEQSRPGSQE